MKKIIAVIVTLMMLFTAVMASASDIKVLVNGEDVQFDRGAVAEDDSVLIPFRFVLEKLGANVTWFEETKTIFTEIDASIITLQIGNNLMFTNDTAHTLQKAPVINVDRTLVSPEVIEKATGAKVLWNAEEKTVSINK